MNQPEPLKVFLQHRIRSIIAKEWWDFVVNVNNMNSDHASLLYSVANLCPSFQHFLKSRDKEIIYILKKRPVIKPRIFSGSERSDVPSEPPLPPREIPPPKKSCSAELEKILNELYPNEKSFVKRKPQLSGPASKQRKTPTKKFQSAYSLKDKTREVTNNAITLASLLREDHSSLTALSAHRTYKVNSPPKNVMTPKENSNKKVEYAVSDFDVNRNKLSNKMKIKKVIKKVKKKRYFLTDKFSPIRSYLEDETPELKIEWIKRYKIKKCSINIKRLSNKQIIEALRPKLISMPIIHETSEVNDKPDVTTIIKSELPTQITSPIQPSENQTENEPSTTPALVTMKTSPREPVISTIPSITSSVSPSCSVVTKIDEEKLVSESPPGNSLTPSTTSEKGSENSNSPASIKYRSNQKENVDIAEKYKPKELNKDLKTYYKGGIVPLGKKVTTDKTRHFLSLKEKKIKESSLDLTDSVSPLKEKNVQNVNTEPKPEVLPTLSIVKCTEQNNESIIGGSEKSPEDNKLEADEVTAENGLENSDNIKDDEIEQPIVNAEINDANVDGSEDEVDTDDGALVIDESKETDKNSEDAIDTIASNSIINSADVVEHESPTDSVSQEVIVINDSQDEINDVEADKIVERHLDVAPKIKIEQFQLDDSIINNSNTLSPANSFDSKCSDEKVTLTKNVVVISTGESEQEFDKLLEEPLAKRPRIEVNLAEMKLNITTKASPEIENLKDDLHCRLCSETFNSVTDWLSHFDKEVPKCTPNLQVAWDRPEVPLLN